MEPEQSEPHYQKAEGSTLPFVNLGFNMQTPTVAPSTTHTMALAAGPSPGFRGLSSPAFTLSSPLMLSDSLPLGGKTSMSRQPAAPTSQASRPSTLPSRPSVSFSPSIFLKSPVPNGGAHLVPSLEEAPLEISPTLVGVSPKSRSILSSLKSSRNLNASSFGILERFRKMQRHSLAPVPPDLPPNFGSTRMHKTKFGSTKAARNAASRKVALLSRSVSAALSAPSNTSKEVSFAKGKAGNNTAAPKETKSRYSSIVSLSSANGSSCHQCKSRRPTADLSFCRNIRSRKGDRRQRTSKELCRKKYCDQCLRKFYHEHPPAERDTSTSTSRGKWPCPACRRICCCAACRRAKSKGMVSKDSSTILAMSPATSLACGLVYFGDIIDTSFKLLPDSGADELEAPAKHASFPKFANTARARYLASDTM